MNWLKELLPCEKKQINFLFALKHIRTIHLEVALLKQQLTLTMPIKNKFVLGYFNRYFYYNVGCDMKVFLKDMISKNLKHLIEMITFLKVNKCCNNQ